jgi:hypothetical protein
MLWGNVCRVDHNGHVVKAGPRHAGSHQQEGGDKGFCVAYKQGGKNAKYIHSKLVFNVFFLNILFEFKKSHLQVVFRVVRYKRSYSSFLDEQFKEYFSDFFTYNH